MSSIQLVGWPEDIERDERWPSSLWLKIFATGFAFVVVLFILTLFTPVPYGDLSRVAMLSEIEFGWRRSPPPLVEQELQGVDPAQADIFVVGDSFSFTHVWQAELVRAGYRVSTIYWANYDEAMCGDFDQWIKRAGFNGKLVILESVERLFADRMKRSEACANSKMTKPLVVNLHPQFPPKQTSPGSPPNWNSKLMSGITTLLRTHWAKQATGDVVIADQIRVRHVPKGCDLFSHRLCDRALFVSQDDENAELQPETAARMQSFTKAQAAFPILWAVIPDKTTTYLMPERSKDFVAALRNAQLGPDLFTLMREQRTQVQDLYFPNDTHLSMHGQVLLGRQMLQAVREKLAEVRPPPN